MRTLGLVAQVWRYPVRSLRGEQLDAATVGTGGVLGDRAYAVFAPDADQPLSAKREPRLLFAAAAYAPGGLVVTLPDGSAYAGLSPELDRALSRWLNRPVSLRSCDGPPAPLHVLTTASLRAAGLAHPAGEWSAGRFRPNVVVDVGGSTYAEDAWLDLPAFDFGEVGCAPMEATVRCPLTGFAQPELADDPEILATLQAEHATRLGIYAVVTRPGQLQPGDRGVVPGHAPGREVRVAVPGL